MDFQSKKINQPFNPNSNYFQGLSNNIQSRVGIEVKNVVETKIPQIEFNKNHYDFPMLSQDEKLVLREIRRDDVENIIIKIGRHVFSAIFIQKVKKFISIH